MCRILVVVNAGLYFEKYGRAKLVDAMKTLAKGGNTDACGLAVYRLDGRWAWVRMPVACHLVADHISQHPQLLRELTEDVVFLLVHARKATGGTPLHNVNNHPFCHKDTATCLIHNGWLKAEKLLLTPEEAEVVESIGSPETDSALLLAKLVPKLRVYGNLLEAARKAWSSLSGKASIAVANRLELLYTKNSMADIHIHTVDGEAYALATAEETIKAIYEKAKKVEGTSRKLPETEEEIVKPSYLTLYFVRAKGWARLGAVSEEAIVTYSYSYSTSSSYTSSYKV